MFFQRVGILFLIFVLSVYTAAAQDESAQSSTESTTQGTTATPQNPFQPAHDVSASGSFSYSYPIKIPAGTNGIQPSLSVTYSSASPNGILGAGFSVSGFSTIERDSSRGINLTSADSYLLDGQKLYYRDTDKTFHPENESYDKIQVFRLSAPTTAVSNANYSDAFWVVSKKDGTKQYYGKFDSNDSSAGTVPVLGGTLPRLWALSKIQDANGNACKFQYLYDSATGAYYPLRIIYTFNDNNSASLYKVVKFSYLSRTDHGVVYSPTAVDLDHQLAWISVVAGAGSDGSGGTLVRKYRFTTSANAATGRAQLVEILECGNDSVIPSAGYITATYSTGSTLPPIQFQWNSDAESLTAATPSLPGGYDNTNAKAVVSADVNGDGMSDMVAYHIGDTTGTGVWLQSFVSNGSGGFTTKALVHNTAHPFSGPYWHVSPADVNGDGKTDMVVYYVGDDLGQGVRIQAFFSDGAGGFTPGTYNNGSGFTAHAYSGKFWRMVPADVNGDGMTDMVAYYVGDDNGAGIRIQPFIASANGTYTPGTYQPFIAHAYSSDYWHLEPADANGDGLTDMVAYYIGGASGSGIRIQAFLTNSSGVYTAASYNSPFTTGYGDCWSMTSTDVNGDGKVDMVASFIGSTTGAGIRLQSLLSQGTGEYTAGAYQSFTDHTYSGTSSGTFWRMTASDMNGDGKSDMVAYYVGGDTNSGIRVKSFLSTEAGDFAPQAYNSPFSSGYGAGWTITPSDVNGDGQTDMVAGIYTTTDAPQFIMLSPNFASDLVEKVTLPTGGTIAAEYTPATQVSGAVVPANSAYATGIANASSRPLVTKITTTDATLGGNDIVVTYGYSNGLRLPGTPDVRKDLGFQTVTKTDANAGNVTISTYSQTPPLQGRMTKQTIQDTSTPAKKYFETEYTVESRQDDATNLPLVYFSTVSKTITKQYDGQTTSLNKRVDTLLSDYDAWGNLLWTADYGRVSDTGTPINASGTMDYQAKVQTKYIYVSNLTGDNYLFRVQSKTVNAYDVNAVWGKQAEILYYYDDNGTLGVLGTRGLLTKQQSTIDASSSSVSTMTYDASGNLLTTSDGRVNAGEYSGATNTMTYDTDYHSLTRTSTNALGQITTVSYDSQLLPITVEDSNHQLTETRYDVFGRTVLVAAPGDSLSSPTTQTEYGDFVAPSTFGFVHTTQKTSATGTLESYSYLDGLGRVIETKRSGVGNWIAQYWFYDASGRNNVISVPYTASTNLFATRSTTVKKTTLTFDPAGRVTTTTHPDTTTSQVVYDQVGTTYVDENGHATKTLDYGNDIRNSATTGVYPNQSLYSTITTKIYRGLSTITDNAGNKSYNYTDRLGRRYQHTDPDVGTVVYTYDADGNMTSQTDAKGHVIHFTYDQLNRLLTKDYSDNSLDVHFTYDESGHGAGAVGKLTTVTYQRGSDSYSYDAKGRLTSQTRTLDSLSRTMNFTYDSADRLVTQTYPDGEVVTSSYGADGNLTALTGTANYVSALTYNALGKVTGLSYGNGVTTTYGYYDNASADPNTGLPYSYRLKTVLAGSGNSVMNLTYSYEKNGNVHSRANANNTGYSETYTYDELNRLTGATSTALGTLAFAYNEINNLTQKGGYTYSYGTRPHAPIDNVSNSYTYDANGNMITRSGGRTIDYDDEQRVTAVSDGGSYAYDSGRQRTIKTEGTQTTYYFFDEYEEEYTSGTLTNTIKYYKANSQNAAQRSTIEGLVYIHNDHLGSSSVLTNGSGTVVRSQGYRPYGTDAYKTGSATTKYQFTGQEKDTEGLYYYNARYYDPSLGRFIQADPAVWSGEISANLSLVELANPYIYAMNNPVVYTDPTGLTQTEVANGVWVDDDTNGEGTTTYSVSTTQTSATGNQTLTRTYDSNGDATGQTTFVDTNTKSNSYRTIKSSYSGWSATTYSGGTSKTVILPQTPTWPNLVHCDINTWNQALTQGRNPLPPSGVPWDGNALTADQISALYPQQNTGPQSNTEGIAFQHNGPNGSVGHLFYYRYGTGGTVHVWDSDGIQPQQETDYSLNGRTIPASTFYPLPRL